MSHVHVVLLNRELVVGLGEVLLHGRAAGRLGSNIISTVIFHEGYEVIEYTQITVLQSPIYMGLKV